MEIAEYDLPPPNYYNRTDKGSYHVAWLLNGYFGTHKSKAYLNDIIARLSIGMQIANRLDFAPIRFDDREKHELRAFGNLPSLPRNWGKRNLANHPHAKKDAIFWAIKLQAIERIRCTGFVDHDALRAWAFDLFIHTAKDRSTLKAKVRSVWQWYKDRDWELDTRSFTMSRAEAGRATAEKNAKATEAKVQGAVKSLQFLQEKITITAVCKHSGVSHNTAKKYLKEMGLI